MQAERHVHILHCKTQCCNRRQKGGRIRVARVTIYDFRGNQRVNCIWKWSCVYENVWITLETEQNNVVQRETYKLNTIETYISTKDMTFSSVQFRESMQHYL